MLLRPELCHGARLESFLVLVVWGGKCLPSHIPLLDAFGVSVLPVSASVKEF